eukprot:GEZU01022902.1.p1 GENE.GEZU01022902.1~~GEZU01022902.1.p1  ORF type:complete len:470 (+),score=92.88 GEZU01022902.1:152-1561(+)
MVRGDDDVYYSDLYDYGTSSVKTPLVINTQHVNAYKSYNYDDDYSNARFRYGEEPQIELEATPTHGKSNAAQSIFNICCSTAGAGVLGLPFATREGGWVSLLLLVFMAFMATYTGIILAKCMHRPNNKRLRSFGDIALEAFGRSGPIIVNLLQAVTLIGACALYLIIAGQNLNAMVPKLNMHVWVIIVGAALIPISWLKTMKEISIIAFIGLSSTILLAVVVIVYSIMDVSKPGYIHNNVTYDIFAWRTFPKAFSSFCFACGVHNLLPTVEENMKKPKQFPAVMTASMIIVTVLYLCVSTAGYLAYGTNTQGMILDNLPHGVGKLIAMIAITAHVILAYPLPLNPVCLMLENEVYKLDNKPRKVELPIRIISRTVLVLFTVVVAVLMPYFGDFMSLIGALGVSAAVYILPVLFHLILNRASVRWYEWIWAIFVLLVGLLGSGLGVYTSIASLVDDIKNNPINWHGFFSS